MFWLKKWRRSRIANRQFPDRWLAIIEKNVRIYNRLATWDKEELLRHILVFIAEKRFEGCGGLEITEEMKIIIAALGCMLILHRRTDYYPGLSTILVYPNAFVANRAEFLPGGVIAEGPQVLLGESHQTGVVILSWDDVKHDAADAAGGRNVVFHEFAHQIDITYGRGDSSSVLENNANFLAWAAVLQKNYERLRQAAAQNQPAFLDKYGAIDPAEFFAVATEFFFQKPKELKQSHPDLYNEMKNFYNQDPANI